MSLTKVTNSMIAGAALNPIDFGADSTGTSDSAAAVQSVAAATNTVNVTDGTYKLGTEITMAVPKDFQGTGPLTTFSTTSGFGATPIFNVSPTAGSNPKDWTIANFNVTNNGSATSVFKLNLDVAGKYLSKFSLKNIISNTAVSSNKFVELYNVNTDGLFTSVFSDNWSYGGYYLDNVGDSVYLERNTTTGPGVGYYVNQLGTAANVTIRDGNCTSAGGALNMVKGANLTFENMQVECPDAFTGSNNAAVSIYRPSGGSIYNTKIINSNINTQGNPNYCIYVNNAVQTLIDGNELYCDVSTGAHIYIDSGARDTIIGNNKYYNRATGAETSPIIVNNGGGTVGVWTNATLVDWTTLIDPTNGFPAGYFKDRDGTVLLRGNLTGSATGSAITLFVLPVGYRPKSKVVTIYKSNSSTTSCAIQIEPTGTVKVLTTTATSVYLDGVSFSTL